MDLDWEECYWDSCLYSLATFGTFSSFPQDLSREEEIQDDPQAKLWLLVHLHKKDAEKVRWPEQLLQPGL